MPGVPSRTQSSTALAPIQGVVFDVDGTLYAQAPLRLLMAVKLALAGLARPRGFPLTLRILRSYRRAQEQLRRSAEPRPDLGQAQLDLAARRAGCEPAAVERCVGHWMERAPLSGIRRCRRSGLARTLRDLRSRGLRIGVYSDYTPDAKLEVLGIQSLVDAVVSSTDPDVGTFKPHPEGFLAVARKLGLPPAAILYVGDREDVDVRGARAAGMRAAIVRRSGASWRDGVLHTSITGLGEAIATAEGACR